MVIKTLAPWIAVKAGTKMSIEIPRLPMFADPNRFGKSTLKTIIRPELFGAYINPDDIENTLKTSIY